MKYLFNNAIYDSKVHANIPKGAVEMTEEQYQKRITPPGEYYNFVDGEWILDETAAKAGTVAKLWQGATNYCESQINAAEYAKSLNLAGNSKAAENIAWYDAVWLDYYNRCALVESGDLDVSLDFSNNGSKPWKFWQVVQA